MPLDGQRKDPPAVNPAAWSTSPQFDSVDTEIILVRQYAQGPNGPLTLYADPVGPLDAVTLEVLQSTVAPFVSMNTGLNPPEPPAGGALTPGTLWFSPSDAQLYIWYQDPNSAQWVIANNTGIQDAPVGQTLYGPITYGRANRTWVPVLALTGGIMTGSLILAWDPTVPLEAATKGYVDGHITSSLFGYLPLSGGQMVGQLLLSGDPTVPLGAATKEYVDGLAGIVPVNTVPPASPNEGQLWFDAVSAQLFLWYVDGGYGQWVQANASPGGGGGGGGVIPPGTYVPVTGGTMTGALILNGQPSPATDPNTAATVGYVDSLITGQVSFLGTCNASTGIVTYTAASGLGGQGNLVPAIDVPDSYVICAVAGVWPVGPLQGQAMNVGDWAISDGIQWSIINVQGQQVFAQNVTVSPAVMGSNNLQIVLQDMQATFAPINSPNFQGSPTAPAPGLNDASARIVTSNWIAAQGFLNDVVLVGDVNSVPQDDLDALVMIGDITGATSVVGSGTFIDDLVMVGDATGSDSTAPDFMTAVQLTGDASSVSGTTGFGRMLH